MCDEERAMRPPRGSRQSGARGLLVILATTALVAGCGTSVPTTQPARSVGVGTPEVASAGPPGTSALPPAGPVLEPRAAAAAVLGAADDDARRAAILGILRGVNLGVYTPDGHQVLAGGERSMDDVWIYDFEVDGLAASVRDGDEIQLDDIAAGLAEFATANGGGALTAADVAAHVRAAARSVAADPGQPRAYALAVAIELSRQGRSGTDLAQPPPDGPVVLDGLAAFLVNLDLVLPLAEAAAPAARGVPLVASLTDVGPATAAGCYTSSIGSPTRGWIAGVGVRGPEWGPMTSVPNASFDRYLQSQVVGGLVEAKLDGPRAWHHDHTDSGGAVTPGGDQKYTFSIRLRVRAPRSPVACGPLAGFSPPSEGEIVGADVAWDHPELDRHAAIVQEDAMTDALGTSYLVTDPNAERYPSAIGPEQKKTIAVSAQVNVLKALGGDLYSKLAGVPAIQRRTVYTEVSWHRSYAVDIELASSLTITRGVTYKGPLGKATAQGTIPVIEFREGSSVPIYHGVEVVNPGFLTTSTTPARTRGRCNTEWVLQKSGASRKIDWQVRDLVIWPAADFSLWMDTGANPDEQPDNYDGKICTRGGTVRLGPSPGNVWESFVFLGHPQGLVLDKHQGNGHWSVSSDPNIWARGGDLATWTSDETCGGRCTGPLIVVVRIRPLPGP
jgi:hypothetical protein